MIRRVTIAWIVLYVSINVNGLINIKGLRFYRDLFSFRTGTPLTACNSLLHLLMYTALSIWGYKFTRIQWIPCFSYRIPIRSLSRKLFRFNACASARHRGVHKIHYVHWSVNEAHKVVLLVLAKRNGSRSKCTAKREGERNIEQLLVFTHPWFQSRISDNELCRRKL